MKKVTTFLFAFVLFSFATFAQNAELSEKVNTIVEGIKTEVKLTPTQEAQVSEILLEAMEEIIDKGQKSANDREGYTTFRHERMDRAFDSMDAILSGEQIGSAKKVAGEMGLVRTAK